jgi:hypothetical protein
MGQKNRGQKNASKEYAGKEDNLTQRREGAKGFSLRLGGLA